MKRFFLVLFLINAVYASAIDVISFGIIAGFNTSLNSFRETSKLNSYDNLLGYNANLFLRIKSKTFLIQPELGYYNNRANINYDEDNKNLNAEISLGDLYSSLLMGVRFSKIRILAGPLLYSTTHLHYESTIAEIPQINRNSNDNNLKWGIQAGLGINLSERFCLDGRFQKSFTKSSYEVQYNDNSSETIEGTLGSISLSLGFSIVK